MSFPPRPPMMPMGGMPPMMPPYGYPGMMPPMGMMNPMNRPMMPANMMNPNIRMPMEKSMSTTVFVGNIPERAPDQLIRGMLQRCGTVLNWKRAQGTNGKLQAFGFCEYDDPESTLRCIRLLNGYEIGEKKISVKVDQKTRELLSDYLRKTRLDDKAPLTKNAKKAAIMRNIPSKKGDDADEDDKSATINLELVDEDTLKQDRIVIGSLELLLKQYNKDLVPPEPVPEAPPAAPAPVANIETPPPANPAVVDSPVKSNPDTPTTITSPAIKLNVSLTEDKKETNESRDKHKEDDVKPREDRDRQPRERSDRDRDRQRTSSPGHNGVRSPDSRSSYNRSHHRDSRHDQERSVSRSRSPESRQPRSRRNGDSTSYDSPSGSLIRNNSSRSIDEPSGKENRQSVEDSDEVRERKKLERKLREKEMAYRERLKQWETREQKRGQEYAAERKKEVQKRRTLIKEAKKLKQFLEDYDDEKDDQIYYKGSNLEKLLKSREKEIEMDDRDRQREREELEDLKRKLIEKGHADAETEAKRIQNDENLKLKTKFEKLDQSSSSSEDEDSDNQTDSEQPQLQRNNSSSASLSNNFNSNNKLFNYAASASEPTADKSNEKEEKKTAEQLEAAKQNEESHEEKMEVPRDTDHEKPEEHHSNGHKISSSGSIETTGYDSLDESSQQYSQELSSKSKEPINTNENSYSPSSNSPTFSGFNAASINPLATHSVTIKTMVKKSIQPINQLFADDDDDQGTSQKRARLSGSLSQSTSNSMNSDERKKAVKKLVESIPTDRDKLFAYPIDWEQLDSNLMEKRIKPWINKKIIEYIGEEEESLNDFICNKIQQRTPPEKLLDEVKVILDSDSELFIKKMWRLVVYETESKRCGLSK